MKKPVEIGQTELEEKLENHTNQEVVPQEETYETVHGVTGDAIFMTEEEKPDWTIQGIAKRGELLMLGGEAKLGKSLLGVDIIYALLTGISNDFIRVNPMRHRVLHISKDEPRAATEDSYRRRGVKELDIEIKKNLAVIYINGVEVNFERFDVIETELQRFKPHFVLIDCLRKMCLDCGYDESSTRAGEKVAELAKLCNQYGATCILIHHTKKGEVKGVEKFSGHGSLVSSCDAAMLLEPVTDNHRDARRRLHLLGGRQGVTPFSCNLRINTDEDEQDLTGFFLFEGYIDDEPEDKTAVESILSFLIAAKGQGYHIEEISEKLKIPEAVTKVTLWRLVRKGKVSRYKEVENPNKTRKRWLYKA
jgi:hypothetical protein